MKSIALGIVASELRFLKRGQNAATDTGRVFDALETGRDLDPALMTEIRYWVKVKNPKAPAIKREAEEDWGLPHWIRPKSRSRQAVKEFSLWFLSNAYELSE